MYQKLLTYPSLDRQKVVIGLFIYINSFLFGVISFWNQYNSNQYISKFYGESEFFVNKYKIGIYKYIYTMYMYIFNFIITIFIFFIV